MTPPFFAEEGDNDKEESYPPDDKVLAILDLTGQLIEIDRYPRRPVFLEEWLRDHPSPVKMFRAWSVFDIREHGPKKMHWYVTKRDESVFLPYESFVFGYIPDKDRGEPSHEKDALYECFTEEEISLFKEYLKGDETLHVKELDLPFYNSAGGYGDVEDFAHDRWYEMKEEPGYPLPFDVHGVIFMY